MDHAFIFTVGWIFFGLWATALTVGSVIAFRHEMPTVRRPRNSSITRR